MKQLLAVFSLLTSIASFAQPQQTIIDSLFYGANGIKAKHPTVGVVVGIYADGKTAYYALGTRGKNSQQPLDSLTLFEVGSATKTFTALLLAQAIESKTLRQDAFIDSYLPKNVQLKPALKLRVRLTDLASHQSGLPNLSNDSYFEELLKQNPRNPFRTVSKAYLYNILRKTDSLQKHESYQYNNYAFSLLGALLENRCGKQYAILLHDGILRPLKMKYTTLAIPSTANVAGLYNQQGEPQEHLILNAVDPAGGLKSNAVDILKYLKAHLSPATHSKAISLTQQPFYKDAKRTVGLGWDIVGDYYQKDGDTFGNSMLMRYSPTRQVAIVVLSNHQNGQLVSDAVNFIDNRLRK